MQHATRDVRLANDAMKIAAAFGFLTKQSTLCINIIAI